VIKLGDKKTELTVTELQQRLSKMPVDEVYKLLIECFKASKEAKNFISVKLIGNKAIKNLWETSKEKIENEFFPANGFGKLQLSVAKKAISDFKKISKNNRLTIDLMIFYIEMCVDFFDTYGGASDSLINSMCSMFGSVIKMLNKEDKPDLFLEYQVRLESLISRADDFGWGIQDAFDESYLNLKWLEEYEESVDGKNAEENETSEEKWIRIPQDSRDTGFTPQAKMRGSGMNFRGVTSWESAGMTSGTCTNMQLKRTSRPL